MREPRMYVRQWRSLSRMRTERFAELFGQGDDTPFDEKFIETVQKRRDEMNKLILKLWAFQLPVIIFLVLSLIPIDAGITLFGISPSGGQKLREVLLIVSALLGLGNSVIALQEAQLSELINGYIDKKSKANKEVREYLGLGYGVDSLLFPRQQSVSPVFMNFMLFFAVTALLFMFVVVLGVIYLHVMVLRDIYVNPSFSRTASVLVIAFVVAGDVISFGFLLLRHGIVALRDYSNMHELAKRSDKDRESVVAVYQSMYANYRRKSWIVRLFTRPAIPRELPEWKPTSKRKLP